MNSTYNSPGPYKHKMHFWPQRISTSSLPAEVQLTTRARDRTVKAKVWYPTKAAKGPDVPKECPLVLFTNGFRMLSDFYTEYAEHLASWGYVALQYDLITCYEPASPVELVDDATLVTCLYLHTVYGLCLRWTTFKCSDIRLNNNCSILRCPSTFKRTNQVWLDTVEEERCPP